MAVNFEKISLTAKLAAYMRQFSDIPFASDISQQLHAEAAFEQLLGDRGMRPQDLLWYAPIFEVRYKSIAAILHKSGVKQILELASGFSLRGLIATQDPSITYVESDLEDLTAEKTTLVFMLCQQHKLDFPRNLHFAVANALDGNQLHAAIEGFRPDQPIAIVNEGLLLYLSAGEMETMARNVRDLLREFNGIWITPDFTLKQDARDISEQQRQFRAIVAAATDRKMYNNAFENDDQMNAFFASLGLRPQVFNQLDLAPHIVSMERLKLPAQFMEGNRSRLKLWVLEADSSRQSLREGCFSSSSRARTT